MMVKLAMWSGPRNLSTAMMYSFAARGDCAAWDEPFYAAYLAATGADHPMREAILAAGETDPARALARLCAEVGMPWTDAMLRWPEGPKPYDGAWAPHWYNAVHRSTGFAGPEGPLPEVPEERRALLDAALPLYQAMRAEALRFG
jgi:hypothetical protein